MATILDLLRELNKPEREVPAQTADLAGALHASKETTLKQLRREAEKGNVEGSSEEGWKITDQGRVTLEKGAPPTMIDEGVTPRQQFQAIGQRIGIPKDRITIATDIVWSGEYNDIKWVWEALGQADIADDLRNVWVNAWRAKIHKPVPPELEVELTGAPGAKTEGGEDTTAPAKVKGRDFIIVDDEPVRVGAGLGDFSLQDAKDILSIRAVRSRLSGGGGSGGGLATTGEKVSDLISALQPYLAQGTDLETFKEIIGDKLALFRQDILSQIPKQGQLTQPKSLVEEIKEIAELGPLLKTIMGIPEPSANQPTMTPVQLTTPEGKPLVLDLNTLITYQKFQGDERRADERHSALMGLAQTVRENLPDGVAAIKRAVEESKGGAGAKIPPASQGTVFECADCHTRFTIPDVPFEKVKCPNTKCGREYSREEVMSA